jgi:hypothetical protein
LLEVKVSAPVDEDLLYTFMKYIVGMMYSSSTVPMYVD